MAKGLKIVIASAMVVLAICGGFVMNYALIVSPPAQRQVKNSYEGNLERWREGIRHGDVGSMYGYGLLLYENGEDRAEGFRWIRRAADMGYDEARYFLQHNDGN